MPLALPIQVIPSLLSHVTHDNDEQPSTTPARHSLLQLPIASH
jgi:hypothetical protein